jgi:D-sedoheptulose 7-phosphate isomerase
MDRERLLSCISDSAGTIAALSGRVDEIGAASEAIVEALRSGAKVLTAGNGGSSAEALHMAEEIVGRFRGNRVSLPAVCLAADSTALTCIANDFGYDCVFSRQVEGLGRNGDVLVLFSTTGSARNLELALGAARAQDMKVVSLLGRDGGALRGRSDYEVLVEGSATERIQEAHQVILHLVLDAIEDAFPPSDADHPGNK